MCEGIIPIFGPSFLWYFLKNKNDIFLHNNDNEKCQYLGPPARVGNCELFVCFIMLKTL
jgi:hypothetical protein